MRRNSVGPRACAGGVLLGFGFFGALERPAHWLGWVFLLAGATVIAAAFYHEEER